MMSKKWQCKLLSVVLCASLIAPNLTVSAYAAEIDQGVQIGGGGSESLEEDFVIDGVMEVSEPSTENAESNQPEVVETQEPVVEQTSQEPEEGTVSANELGSFSDVEVVSQGFYADVTGNFTLNTGIGEDVVAYIYLVQYDRNHNRLFSTYTGEASVGNSVISIAHTDILIHDDTAYFRLKAKEKANEEVVSYSDYIERTNVPSFTLHVDKVYEGGSVGFQMSYDGDMQMKEDQTNETFYVELVGGTSENPDTWKKLSDGSCTFYKNKEEVSIADFSWIEQQQYYGKLVFYMAGADSEEYSQVRLVEKEVSLSPFSVTDSIGYFENVKMEFGGMGVEAKYDFVYTGYEYYKGVNIYLVQYDKDGNELYAHDIHRNYNGANVWIYKEAQAGPTLAHKDAVSFRMEARGEAGTVVSESVTRDASEIPQISFSIDDSRTTIYPTRAYYSIAFNGNMFHEDIFTNAIYKAVLRVGTTENEEEWKEIEATNPHINFSYMGNASEGFAYAEFKGLEPGNIYYGEIVLTAAQSNGGNQGYDYLWSTTIPVTFRTEAICNLAEEFPDEALRSLIIERLGSKYSAEDGTAAESALKEITYLEGSRYDFTKEAVKDLTGLDLLTGLETLYLHNNEIQDAGVVDWSKLTSLSDLILRGNDLTELPDLSANSSLWRADFAQNRLSAEELAKAEKKLPTGVTLDDYTLTSQRVNGFEVLAEETYYFYGSTVDLYVQAKGCKSELPYTVKFYIDDTEQTMEVLSEYDKVYALKDAALTEGNHILKVELWKGNTGVEETILHPFKVVRQDAFGERSPYYMGSDNMGANYSVEQKIDVTVYFTAYKEIEYVEMVKDGKVYAQPDAWASFYANQKNGDPRYQTIGHLSNVRNECSLWYTSASLYPVYYTVPAGSYDLKLTFTDGSTQMAEGAVVVSSGSEIIISDCELGFTYDHMGKYIYVILEGWNIDPAKLEYTILQNEKSYSVNYVNHKYADTGMVVKLEKDGWMTLEDGWITIKIEGDGQAANFLYECYSPTSGVYYIAYNPLTGQVEAAFTADLASQGKTVNVSVRKYGEEETIASGSAVVSDGIGYFDLKYTDGTTFPNETEDYYFDFILDGVTYAKLMYINQVSTAYRANSWSGNSYIYEGNDSPVMWYYSNMKYNSSNAEASSYQAQIAGGTLEEPVVITSKGDKVKTDRVNDMVAIGMEFEESVLKPGTYEITLYKDGSLISAREFTVKSTKQFVLSSVSVSWKNQSELNVWLTTENSANSDDYTVTLTDIEGNQVEGLKSEVTGRYKTDVSISVKGLSITDAAKKYYVKVTHNTLGEPYDTNGNKFYVDARGEYMSLRHHMFGYNLDQDNRTVGIHIYEEFATLPVTIGIYRPYLTEPVTEIQVTDKAELNDGSYYFGKSLYDRLPDKNGMYDIVCVDANKNAEVFENHYINYREGYATRWSHTVDKNELFINDEENKTAVVNIYDNKGKPTYKSSDTGVATIQADETDPNKAVITAVGMGMTTISITADGLTKQFAIVVGRKVTLERLELSQSDMILGVGESKELIASVLPAEAWNEELEFEFTLQNAEGTVGDVIRIERGSDKDTVIITAVGTGTATITAVVTNPEKTIEKAAGCVVTVKNIYTEEEQNRLIQTAGIQYVLVNAYPKMKATLKDITLPDGWTWEDDSVQLAADDGAPIQYYMAEYVKDGYEPFTALLPVAVSQLTKVSVDGAKTIVMKSAKEYRAEGQYKGYQPQADEYAEALTYQWTAAGSKPVVTLAEANKKAVSITANEVAKNTSQTVNLVVTVGEKSLKASAKIMVTTEPCIDAIHVKVAESQPDAVISKYEYGAAGILTIDKSAISTEKDNVHNVLRLSALASVEGKEVTTEKGFKWSSSDTSVVAVKAEEGNASAVLTFKKAGSAVLHITAQDDGKYDKEVLVLVKDYTPVLESAKIALDVYSVEGAVIPVKSQNGNSITGIEIQEQDSATKEWSISNKFKTESQAGTFYVKMKEGYAPEKNETVKVQLQILTRGQEAVTKNVTISVNVKKKPSASVKVVSKANLFETGAEAVYKITSKYEIESIEDITVDENGTYRGRVAEKGFRLAETADEKLILNAGTTLNSETLEEFKESKSPLCQVKLRVNFKGYSDDADQTITLTVATENKKPSLKLNDAVFFEKMVESKTQVYDTKNKEVYLLAEDVTISSNTDNVTVTRTEDGKVKVGYGGERKITYKATMVSPRWTQPLSISGKITNGSAESQKMILGNEKVVLNMEHNIQNHGKLEIPVAIAQDDIVIEKVSYQINSSNRKLFDSGYLYISFSKENQMIYIGLNKGMGEDIKPDTYKVNFTGEINIRGNEQKLKATTLTITLTDQEPSVTLKGVGSIDLVRRQDSSVIYTPTYKNVTATAKQVILSGAYGKYFHATVEEGKVIVTATDKAMSTKISYPLTINLILDNGCEVSSAVKIKPINKLPKLTAEMTKATLYKANPEAISYQVLPKDSNTSIDRMERVEDKNSKYFSFRADGDRVTVSLTEEAKKMKPGKYTVSYKVYMEGAAYNVKPTTLKLTVTVK